MIHSPLLTQVSVTVTQRLLAVTAPTPACERFQLEHGPIQCVTPLAQRSIFTRISSTAPDAKDIKFEDLLQVFDQGEQTHILMRLRHLELPLNRHDTFSQTPPFLEFTRGES